MSVKPKKKRFKKSPKIICLTGGVISSLGKGIAAASLGNLFKARGYSVGIIKLDPYINVDPGTMSPFQHGEVYVTEDGAETDLDLGHYERFLGSEVSRQNNVTAGHVYDSVIKRERAGDYLGNTVQVIPHITDEIKSRILTLADDYDILLVEIGGTVGDIESLPFLEAVRQLRRELFTATKGADTPGRICYVHLTLVPFQKATEELKTKPTQHSVAALRHIGITPSIVVCRSERPLKDAVKEKIALFADVDPGEVISMYDVDTIYRVPTVLKKAKLDHIILKYLKMKVPKLDLSDWESFVKNIERTDYTLNIGIVGKYVQLKDAYKSIQESVVHACAQFKAKPVFTWIQSEEIERGTVDLGKLDGMIVPGGFGERGIEGKIMAIQYARENKIPFLGICLGLQCAVIEFARNACNLDGANSVEFDEKTKYPVIHIMASQKSVTKKGGTMRLGSYKCKMKTKSRVAALYQEFAGQSDEIVERHRHRYEVNNTYKEKLAKGGLIASGLSPDRTLVEIMEYADHPYYVACQFHPEFKSRPLTPHPLFLGLIKAAIETPDEDN